ncbi:MAG: hypothetical protein EA382_06220 [Spirochaetaceae bacterium]|nr:MAG: hypothetical protein EA382_06220 [Spirochaetaceae bacterium]
MHGDGVSAETWAGCWNSGSAKKEQDENCCVLAIQLTQGTLNSIQWEGFYYMDFVNRIDMWNGGIT